MVFKIQKSFLFIKSILSCLQGIVRACGGHAVALKWSMKNSFDVNPGEVC